MAEFNQAEANRLAKRLDEIQVLHHEAFGARQALDEAIIMLKLRNHDHPQPGMTRSIEVLEELLERRMDDEQTLHSEWAELFAQFATLPHGVPFSNPVFVG